MGTGRAVNPSLIEIFADFALVHLSQGGVATIDIQDVPLVSGINWQRHISTGTTYATRRFRDGNVIRAELMHRRILSMKRGVAVDHMDGDGLNNRRANLRPCSYAENSANVDKSRRSATGFVGVYANDKRFQARICIGGKRVFLGSFRTPEEAHARYMAERNVAPEFFSRAPAFPSKVEA